MQFWNEKQNCKLTTPLGWVDGPATSDTCEQRTAPKRTWKTSTPIPGMIEPSKWSPCKVGDLNLPQTMASMSIQRMGCWWFCIFHFRVNHYVTQIPISIDLHPRFGRVLLVHVCFQNTEIPYSRCIWVHMEYEKSDHPRLRHCLTHIGTLKLIIFCWNSSSL